jgi:hypothetical protein
MGCCNFSGYPELFVIQGQDGVTQAQRALFSFEDV